MTFPTRSVGYWPQWISLEPTTECALGTLSPEPTDQDSNGGRLVPQLSEGDMVHVQCHLDPDLFQNTIPGGQEGRSAWTMKQRDKAGSCLTLQTVDELSAWVSYLRDFWVGS